MLDQYTLIFVLFISKNFERLAKELKMQGKLSPDFIIGMLLGADKNIRRAPEMTPWRIGTLKYLEVKIEEWPSRAKWGQAGPNRSKWCQMVPNGAKQGQTGSNGAKKGQKGPTEPNGAQKGKWGQTRPNGVIWG